MSTLKIVWSTFVVVTMLTACIPDRSHFRWGYCTLDSSDKIGDIFRRVVIYKGDLFHIDCRVTKKDFLYCHSQDSLNNCLKTKHKPPYDFIYKK